MEKEKIKVSCSMEIDSLEDCAMTNQLKTENKVTMLQGLTVFYPTMYMLGIVDVRNSGRFEGSRSSELIIIRNVEEAIASVFNNSDTSAKVCALDVAFP